jgi:hypothetical protein
MKQLATAAAAIFLVAGPAFAQMQETTTTTTTISPADDAQIREYVTKEHHESFAPPPGFTLSTGAVLPPSVELYAFPPDARWGEHYRYTVIGDQPVLVDPSNRHIIEVIH